MADKLGFFEKYPEMAEMATARHPPPTKSKKQSKPKFITSITSHLQGECADCGCMENVMFGYCVECSGWTQSEEYHSCAL